MCLPNRFQDSDSDIAVDLRRQARDEAENLGPNSFCVTSDSRITNTTPLHRQIWFYWPNPASLPYFLDPRFLEQKRRRRTDARDVAPTNIFPSPLKAEMRGLHMRMAGSTITPRRNSLASSTHTIQNSAHHSFGLQFQISFDAVALYVERRGWVVLDTWNSPRPPSTSPSTSMRL
jgi:hypothetical protein